MAWLSKEATTRKENQEGRKDPKHSRRNQANLLTFTSHEKNIYYSVSILYKSTMIVIYIGAS
jgi:ribosomal protein L6P/L9E